tara:strand:- start:1163 stop:1888 length:726 start_codon:yes stop_codon:yes gene_type:complete
MANIALIPARSGSKRCINKNIRLLNGTPLLAHTVDYSVSSNCINKTYIVTDSSEYEEIACSYGANTCGLRPKQTAEDTSSDIDWIKWSINKINGISDNDLIYVLRPTNPFRKSQMVRKALDILKKNNSDSVRGVELCKQHPMKSWILDKKSEFMLPLNPSFINGTPAHSNQYANLPNIYIQNASIELFRVSNIAKYGNFSGFLISPLITEEYEGFDINYELDFIVAETLLSKGIVKLKSFN